MLGHTTALLRLRPASFGSRSSLAGLHIQLQTHPISWALPLRRRHISVSRLRLQQNYPPPPPSSHSPSYSQGFPHGPPHNPPYGSPPIVNSGAPQDFPQYFQDPLPNSIQIPPQPQSGANPPPPPPPKRPRFSVARVGVAVVFFLVGYIFVKIQLLVFHAPKHGTLLNAVWTLMLRTSLPMVINSQPFLLEPAWGENWKAHQALTPDAQAHHYMARTLAGAGGLGAHHQVYRNSDTGDMLSVVYIGRGVAGWPGFAHGGATTALLDESCARAAFAQFGTTAAVTARLDVQFLHPVGTGDFWIIRTRAKDDSELPEEERGKRHRKAFVVAQLVHRETGKAHVRAEAVFVGGEAKGGNIPALPTKYHASKPWLWV